MMFVGRWAAFHSPQQVQILRVCRWGAVVTGVEYQHPADRHLYIRRTFLKWNPLLAMWRCVPIEREKTGSISSRSNASDPSLILQASP